jgi:hypothetical protein
MFNIKKEIFLMLTRFNKPLSAHSKAHALAPKALPTQYLLDIHDLSTHLSREPVQELASIFLHGFIEGFFGASIGLAASEVLYQLYKNNPPSQKEYLDHTMNMLICAGVGAYFGFVDATDVETIHAIFNSEHHLNNCPDDASKICLSFNFNDVDYIS